MDLATLEKRLDKVIGRDMRAVSYTHLDVYKRQVLLQGLLPNLLSVFLILIHTVPYEYQYFFAETPQPARAIFESYLLNF